MNWIFIIVIILILFYFLSSFVEINEKFDSSLVPVTSIIGLSKVSQKIVNSQNSPEGEGLPVPGNLTISGNITTNGQSLIKGNVVVNNPINVSASVLSKTGLFFYNQLNDGSLVEGTLGDDGMWFLNDQNSTYPLNNKYIKTDRGSGQPISYTTTGNDFKYFNTPVLQLPTSGTSPFYVHLDTDGTTLNMSRNFPVIDQLNVCKNTTKYDNLTKTFTSVPSECSLTFELNEDGKVARGVPNYSTSWPSKDATSMFSLDKTGKLITPSISIQSITNDQFYTMQPTKWPCDTGPNCAFPFTPVTDTSKTVFTNIYSQGLTINPDTKMTQNLGVYGNLITGTVNTIYPITCDSIKSIDNKLPISNNPNTYWISNSDKTVSLFFNAQKVLTIDANGSLDIIGQLRTDAGSDGIGMTDQERLYNAFNNINTMINPNTTLEVVCPT